MASWDKTAFLCTGTINNIWRCAESIQVKDEEIDWLIYHQIAGCDSMTIGELARKNSLPERSVRASLDRLERNLLVEQKQGTVHALSVNESLFRCHVKYDTSLPYTIENGVIKEKKREGS